jgi:murein DD-endopeptidase MepM/ murein hydrolase activator NlpD
MEKTDFYQNIIGLNKEFMADFKKWILKEGMLFNSYEKWWSKGKRNFAHEGIDLSVFETLSGKVKKLNGKIKVPALFDGAIVKVEKDFLGKSVFIKHSDIISETEEYFYTLYGHLKPLYPLGKKIKRGEAIGLVSDKSLKIDPHIHISFAWIAKGFNAEDITWNNLWNNRLIRLIDPANLNISELNLNAKKNNY